MTVGTAYVRRARAVVALMGISLKIHVHTDPPEAVISYGNSLVPPQARFDSSAFRDRVEL